MDAARWLVAGNQSDLDRSAGAGEISGLTRPAVTR